MTMICTTCERNDAPVGVWLCLECHEKLERENERLEKALDVVCTQIAKHKAHCPGRLYLSPVPDCEKCPRDTIGADWKRWALETAEQAIDKELTTTWIDLVRKYFPAATIGEADFLLWEKTSFPCGRAEEIERQLKDLAERRGSDNA